MSSAPSQGSSRSRWGIRAAGALTIVPESGALQAADQLEQRRLAAAAGSDDGHDLVGCGVQRHPGQRLHRPALGGERPAHELDPHANACHQAREAPLIGASIITRIAPSAGITPQVRRVSARPHQRARGAISAGVPASPPGFSDAVRDATACDRAALTSRAMGRPKPVRQLIAALAPALLAGGLLFAGATEAAPTPGPSDRARTSHVQAADRSRDGAGPAARVPRARHRPPTSPVVYHGGEVMRNVTLHTIFWAPPGYHFDGPPSSTTLGYEALIKQFLVDVAHDSSDPHNAFSTLTQYHDGHGPGSTHIAYDPATDSIDLSSPYPPRRASVRVARRASRPASPTSSSSSRSTA